MAKSIPLSQGKFTIVDDEDFESLSKFKWCLVRGYAARSVNYKNKEGRKSSSTVSMHREIMNAAPLSDVDHINRNTLDNRRSNLRICTRRQNSWNTPKQSHNTSGFKGVFFTQDKKTKPWRASIRIFGKLKHLGYFEKKEGAASAYNDAAKSIFGEFARLNEIPA